MITIHHIGYLVKNIEKAVKSFKVLGYTSNSSQIYDPYRDIDICLLTGNATMIELVSPSSEKSIVYNLLKKYQNVPYHLCYRSDDFINDLKMLERKKYMRFEDPMPAPALGGRLACYLMNTHIGLIELVDMK